MDARRYSSLACAVLVAACATSGGGAHPPVATMPAAAEEGGELDARMDAYIRRLVPLGFSGQVIVARGDSVLVDGAYGWADRATRRPLTRDTPIGIASASKQITAAAVLKLVEQGRISLDDSLPKYFEAVPPDKQGITLRMLIAHTSGIRGGASDDFDQTTLQGTVRRLLEHPLTFAPGEGWRYSSDAYNLLAAVVQQVSGVPYEEFVERELFAPAGMRRSGFWNQAAGDTTVAHAYVGWRDRGSPAVWPRNWRVFGSGDVLTTAGDLLRWHKALRDGKVLAPETVRTYFQPLVKLPEGTASYGFGLFHDRSARAGTFIEHGGDTELGYNASVFRYPDADAVIIVTSNSQSHAGVSARHFVGEPLEKMLFGDTAALPQLTRVFEAEELAAVAGSYLMEVDGEPAGRLDLISDGAVLWATGTGAAIDLLSGTPADSAGLRAEMRTRQLVGELRGGDMEAYRRALAPDGVRFLDDYVGEWRRLVAAHGPLHSFEIIGSVAQRGAGIAYARLRFRAVTLTMSFRWVEDARGRLSGTNANIPDYPLAYPVGAVASHRWVVHDPLRNETRLTIVQLPGGGGLALTGADRQVRMRAGAVQRTTWQPQP